MRLLVFFLLSLHISSQLSSPPTTVQGSLNNALLNCEHLHQFNVHMIVHNLKEQSGLIHFSIQLSLTQSASSARSSPSPTLLCLVPTNREETSVPLASYVCVHCAQTYFKSGFCSTQYWGYYQDQKRGDGFQDAEHPSSPHLSLVRGTSLYLVNITLIFAVCLF